VAVVAMNVIGHFDPGERRQIWRLLAERLMPGGRAVLNLQPPGEPVPAPEFRGAEVQVGRRAYEGWGRAEPAGPDRLTWHMTYRTYQDGRLVAELAVSYDWWLLGQERLRAEVDELGLSLDNIGPANLGMYAISQEGIARTG
jgi:hypothetical protein